MPHNDNKTPAILSIAGHDPTGGAGIIADTEVFIHHQCQPCTIITCLTVQDSSTVHQLFPMNADDILEQAGVLFDDIAITAIKIGLTGSVGCIDAIVKTLQNNPTIPVVFDPVLASGDGTTLANDELVDSILNKLLPLVTVLTPNTLEAEKLSGLTASHSIEDYGLSLLKKGAQYVLITGGHEQGEKITNQLFHNNKLIQQNQWPRLQGDFHGTGCTLAAAIAALIAQGLPIQEAVTKAQTYTDQTIQQVRQIGKGQAFPKRILDIET